MMDQQGGNQDRPFYSFNLESHVPADHLLRGNDRCLDLSELRRQLEPFYSHTGRPSIDPELMVRMLLMGYSFGIRSERRLREEVHLNLWRIAGSAAWDASRIEADANRSRSMAREEVADLRNPRHGTRAAREYGHKFSTAASQYRCRTRNGHRSRRPPPGIPHGYSG